jgi:hypothetical protein
MTLIQSLQHPFSTITVSKIITSKQLKRAQFPQRPQRPHAHANAARVPNDSYTVCIKAKAIGASSGSDAVLAYGLKRLGKTNAEGRSVLINTLVTSLAKEKKFDAVWRLYESKIADQPEVLSPELAASLLSALSAQLEPSFLIQGMHIYATALEQAKRSSHSHGHINHLHNAFLKLLSRHPDTAMLFWAMGLMAPTIVTTDLIQNTLKKAGIEVYIPVSENAMRITQLLQENSQKLQLKAFDRIALTSVMNTLARAPNGTIALAEDLWRIMTAAVVPDAGCCLSLLLVYRNDFSRLMGERSLIRAVPWRLRKIKRVEEIIQMANVDLTADPKFLSVFYEICLNARLAEIVVKHAATHLVAATNQDERIRNCITRARLHLERRASSRGKE